MKRIFSIILLLTLVLILPSALAIGMSPARIEIDFQPGANLTYDFWVLNNLNETRSIELYPTGELADRITIYGDKQFELEGQKVRQFSFSILLPEELEPGLHKSGIGAIEGLPSGREGGTQLAARAAVIMQVWIRVPYPGKYAEISIEAKDVELGQPTPFTIHVKNLGSEDITAEDEIEIWNGDKKVAELSAGSVSVAAKGTENLYASWKADSAGVYKAIANVKYDGKNASASTFFRVGALDIEILDLSKEIVQAGEIAKFKVKLKSKWNAEIRSIYADVEILKDGNVLKTGRSAPFMLGVWEEREIPIYVETQGLELGVYDAKVKVYFDNRTKEKDFSSRLEIVAYKPFEISLPYIIILIFFIFVLLLIALLLLKRRKESHEKRSRRKK
ncbi:MAG: hypothetical protein QXG26_02940 [Candidatus Aenigmatarchaeota archaeon]